MSFLSPPHLLPQIPNFCIQNPTAALDSCGRSRSGAPTTSGADHSIASSDDPQPIWTPLCRALRRPPPSSSAPTFSSRAGCHGEEAEYMCVPPGSDHQRRPCSALPVAQAAARAIRRPSGSLGVPSHPSSWWLPIAARAKSFTKHECEYFLVQVIICELLVSLFFCTSPFSSWI